MCICRRITAIVLVFYTVNRLTVWATNRTASAEREDEEMSVSFLVLAPYAGNGGELDPGWKAGPAIIPAVRLAVDRINSRTDILPGYRVQLLEGNSGCQHGPQSTYSLVSNTFHDGQQTRTSSHVVGVIGPACSESALLLGTLGARETISIIQISGGATSPQLTDTSKYLNTFRTLSTSLQHVEAIIELMQLHSWHNVAVLHDSTRVYFRLTSEKLLTENASWKEKRIKFDSEIDETFYPLGGIEARHKVIVLLAGSQLSREVICVAYHHRPQIIFPVYQWIIIEKTKDQFLTNTQFTYNGRFYNCSSEMMSEAVERAIFTTDRLLGREDWEEETDVDLTFAEYDTLYKSYLREHEMELIKAGKNALFEADAKDYAVSYYDATWALTLALNQTFFGNSNTSLVNYAHGQPETTALIKKHLSRLKFEGLMGTIEFRESTQDSSTLIDIHQCINRSDSILIGVYNGIRIKNKNISEGVFVVDTFYRRVIGVHPTATGTVSLIALTLTLYVLLLHGAFFVFRMHKSIKAESFSLSHFMFSGCYLILLRVLLTAVLNANGWDISGTGEEYTSRMVAFGVTCNVSEWLNSIGVCLVMSTLGGKLWRIYRLFNYFTTPQYLVSDGTLTCFIVVVVTVNVVLLTLWSAVDPFLAVFEQEGIDYNEEEEPVLLERAYCRCTHHSVWVSLTFSVILSLVTCILLLSVLNRRVNRKYFQTAKSVNVMVYLLALSCFLGIALAFVFESLDAHYTYISWQFSLLSIVFLVCLFVFTPPTLTVLKDRFECLANF